MIRPGDLKRHHARAGGRNSAPAELVQTFVVDAEVVSHLVDDGDRDLVEQLLPGRAHPLEGPLEDRHAVRKAPTPVLAPVSDRNPVVDAKEFLLCLRKIILELYKVLEANNQQ